MQGILRLEGMRFSVEVGEGWVVHGIMVAL